MRHHLQTRALMRNRDIFLFDLRVSISAILFAIFAPRTASEFLSEFLIFVFAVYPCKVVINCKPGSNVSSEGSLFSTGNLFR